MEKKLGERILPLKELLEIRADLKKSGKRVVFTNGCFDVLHRGHVDYLEKARSLGDVLIVGLNTDSSTQKIKGPTRPINLEEDRAIVLSSLRSVDFVCFFDEETPLNLIEKLVPDILVKGADWSKESIVGKEIVEKAGGSVQTIDFLPHRSTTNIIQKILDSSQQNHHKS